MRAIFPNRKTAKPLMLSLGLAAVLAGCDAEPDVTEPPPPAADEAVDPMADDIPGVDDTTAMPTEPAEVTVAPMPPPPTDADTAEVPVDLIIITPARYLGQPVIGTAQVADVPSDRGFWLEKNGERIYAVISQSPGMEQAVNIEPGQTVRLAGLVYDSSLAEGIAGQVDPQALDTIADQPAFLLVPATHVAVVEDAAE